MAIKETEKKNKALLQVYVDPGVIADLMRISENYYRTSGKYISRSVYVEKNIILPHLAKARKEGILKQWIPRNPDKPGGQHTMVLETKGKKTRLIVNI